MTVRELIEKLRCMKQDLPVYFYNVNADVDFNSPAGEVNEGSVDDPEDETEFLRAVIIS